MNSPFPWPGGKRALQKTLLALIPKHKIYAEVFAGSAKLLFAKDAAHLEVMNDLNGDVTNFFRVAKHRPAELAERFELECIHAERFRNLRAKPELEDEIDRALRFAYLVWYSFGAKGQHFASSSGRCPKAKRPLDRVRALLQMTAQRLSAVLIEQKDFAEILPRYDSTETFFYLDPPYVTFQANGRYQPLTKDHRIKLFALLANLKGKFLMSFDDCAEIRALSRNHKFKMRNVGVVYTIGGAGERKASPELLISNFALESLGINRA